MKRITKKTINILITFFISIVMTNININALNKVEINSDWQFRQSNIGEWLSATVPGTVHTDLLHNQIIEDPYYRTNEKDLQWIDKVDWEYKTTFNLDEALFNKQNIEIIFNGLDTYADVYLNNSKILSADNMFRTWKVDAKQFLKSGKNELHIVFHSPITKGLELYEKFGLPLPANNDQSENGGLGKNRVSVHTRKAGYHYGWDWGPRFVTSGIWRPIEINAWDTAQIEDSYVVTQSIKDNTAQIAATATINLSTEGNYKLITKLNGKKVAENDTVLQEGEQEIKSNFNIKNPKLWWPVGLGEAHLYTVTQELYLNNTLIDTKETKTGVRTAKLIQKEDADKNGRSFYFEVNGIPVFGKGANYIPNDLFLPRVTLEDYKTVINSAVESNMNMLRVWGGGIYENDEFYELCDEKGIMVWQDFMFACSMYPDTPELQESIKQEAIDNVQRLRNHPSIVLWCGNNEIEVAWSEYDHTRGWGGWRKSYPRAQQNKIWAAYETIFHDILPKVVSAETDAIDYWKSSPSAGPEQVATDETRSGDNHYWGVWHKQHPFSEFNKYIPRFMSEYGFQSFPEFSTVKKYTVPSDWDIESEVMAAHQRSGIGNLRIKQYMESHYKDPKDFESFLYVSQLLQAKGIKEAIEAHRRNMPFCMGSLYWQMNDCWPVASWSSMDYYNNWKAQQYMAKKAFEPIHVSPKVTDTKVEFYVVSDKLKTQKAVLKITAMDFNGKIISSTKNNINIQPNTSTLHHTAEIAILIKGHQKEEVVLLSELIIKNKIVSENITYFFEPKDLKLVKPEIIKTFSISKDGKTQLTLRSKTLVKDVFITLNGTSLKLSDNYFDLLPNMDKTISFETLGIDKSKVEITSLFDTY
ncbi:beta-mannosidase [Hwangdonia lutea]|uniref:Beta-mannosidase n=1 Tax=Hwangdonia lutea TaxID=3075823 RepID=A0AA97HRB5_9FLAO|nr:glycoside hydrolase family 2 protein [Hwangdonia sp. SCSIO 19198]WOD43875.1 glycoside hydrolase family 2 protein [Hwangdonia sp. SCSIO 19198]